VGEAFGDQQLLAVLGRQLGPDPLAIGRRAFADIHRHIEDRAHHAAQQLVLSVRRLLVVKAALNAAGRRADVVVLDEGGGETRLLQRRLAEGLGKPATLIAMARGRDKQHFGDRQRRDLHDA
jgi:hypothetical protein